MFGTPYIQALIIDSMYERYAMSIMIETSLSVECLHITASINSQRVPSYYFVVKSKAQ
jgi:hypothetical protein